MSDRNGSAWLAFSHGTNDAQKSMGIITLILVTGGMITLTSRCLSGPSWPARSAITLGILSGGWRIVRTVGFGIYKVRPLHALNAQITAAGVIFGAALVGAPVSTTHVVSSSIMGIGASERPKAVRWAKAQEDRVDLDDNDPGGGRGRASWPGFVIQVFV